MNYQNAFRSRVTAAAVLLAVTMPLASHAETTMVMAKPKPHHSWRERPTRTVALLDGFQAKPIQRNQYGSRMDQREESTGFFYTAQLDGRWWIIDPEGYRHINRGVVSVKIGTGPAQKEAFDHAFKSKQQWAAQTVALLRENGFTGTGSWTSDTPIQKASDGVSYCVNWNFMTTFSRGRTRRGSGHANYPGDCILVFDPGWEEFCDQHAEKNLPEFRDDPNLLGYFFDNELPLKPNMISRYLKLNERDHGYRAAAAFLQNRHGADASETDLTETDRQEFDDLVMEKYVGTVARAIRRVDANHMLLGPRLYSANTSYDVLGKYIDAFCYNLYGKWSPAKKATELANAIGKPLIVTEFYTKGMDAPGLTNDSGAGWCVPTQADRGRFYQNFCIDLIESKICVGWHWFKYQDNDPTDKTKDPSNLHSNKGILNNQYEPYSPLLSRMRELNTQVYSLADHFDQP
ncbi:agarase [Allorhodopirellula solitaria]|uniref:Agarase n=1 Tax=Allorhodopirellula solitaria TaxID=2527987 RepID=A0A5C5X197_9BACT|nr:agarase [Allorhodopirellula solitaria]TWT56570.1 hypothetical protein CA85_41030 [Allorhodopirellula solitaria]